MPAHSHNEIEHKEGDSQRLKSSYVMMKARLIVADRAGPWRSLTSNCRLPLSRSRPRDRWVGCLLGSFPGRRFTVLARVRSFRSTDAANGNRRTLSPMLLRCLFGLILFLSTLCLACEMHVIILRKKFQIILIVCCCRLHCKIVIQWWFRALIKPAYLIIIFSLSLSPSQASAWIGGRLAC